MHPMSTTNPDLAKTKTNFFVYSYNIILVTRNLFPPVQLDEFSCEGLKQQLSIEFDLPEFPLMG